MKMCLWIAGNTDTDTDLKQSNKPNNLETVQQTQPAQVANQPNHFLIFTLKSTKSNKTNPTKTILRPPQDLSKTTKAN